MAEDDGKTPEPDGPGGPEPDGPAAPDAPEPDGPAAPNAPEPDGPAAPAPDLIAAVRADGLLDGAAGVLVLLSGGRDSVALLDACVGVLGAERVRALHVNYGLREEADDDEAACLVLAARLGVPLETVAAGGPPTTGNLQSWARDVRYGIGAQRVAAAPGWLLAAGHTATDQAETVLYRLAASPGRRALLGMPAQRGLLVRPLLGVTREDTAAWCRARGLPWREDASNTSDRFARGRVRHGLVPALRAVHPAAEANIVRTAELLREEAQVLDDVVDTALAGRQEIGVAHLGALPPALARLVLRRLAEAATGGLCPRAAGRLPDVLALGDGAIDLGDGARAVVRAGVLTVARTPPLVPRGE